MFFVFVFLMMDQRSQADLVITLLKYGKFHQEICCKAGKMELLFFLFVFHQMDFIWLMVVAIKLWYVSSGNLLKTLVGHLHFVMSVCFSADAIILASVSFDRTIKLWDVSTGNLLKNLETQIFYILFVSQKIVQC